MQLGTREIRHIILNNQVVNSSRALHSLKHTVPKSHKNIAIHMVDHIRRLGVFPANYALDLGEFIDSNGNSYIDIVELNPIPADYQGICPPEDGVQGLYSGAKDGH